MVFLRMRRAFTMAEILVVLVLICIVAAILYPVIGKAREDAKQSTCMSNQRALSQALIQYAQNHDHTFPGAVGVVDDGTLWHKAIVDNLDSQAIFACPNGTGDGSLGKPNYGMNPGLYGINLRSIDKTAKVILTADASASMLTSHDAVAGQRHGNGYIASFLDGHVQFIVDDPAAVVYGNGEEGDFLAFGAAGIPIAFSENNAATGTAATVDEGAVIQLINEKNDTLVPVISGRGGNMLPTQGLIPGTSSLTISRGKYKAFSLYCYSNSTTGSKVETTYQFGSGAHEVTIVVKKSSTASPTADSGQPGTGVTEAPTHPADPAPSTSATGAPAATSGAHSGDE